MLAAKGEELLVGLGIGDNNNCMQVEDSSTHHCGWWPMALLHVECLLLLLLPHNHNT